MKKVKIICVKGAPMDMTEEAVGRLMADILGPTDKAGETAADQGKKTTADAKAGDTAVKKGEDVSSLRANVATMCEKHNNIANQVARVIEMDDDEFDPKKAIALARTVIKGRMEAIAILGELCAMGKDDALANMITAADKVSKQYATMYDDLEDRYSASFGLEPVSGKDEEDDSAEEEAEPEEDSDADEDNLMDTILAARACLGHLLG